MTFVLPSTQWLTTIEAKDDKEGEEAEAEAGSEPKAEVEKAKD